MVSELVRNGGTECTQVRWMIKKREMESFNPVNEMSVEIDFVFPTYTDL